MGGGTLQLVAYGGQDIHIIGNPEMSFFKSVYRRHTNFAMECIKQPMLGPIRSEAFKASFKLGRDGDLINKMHLQIKLPEQKNLLLTKGQGSTGHTAQIKTHVLSHIEIKEKGQGYIYGATIKVNNETDIASAIIDKNNRIGKILINDRSGDQYGQGATVIIEGNCNPNLKTGNTVHDDNLPKYGSGAKAEAIISPRGVHLINVGAASGKFYREPVATVTVDGGSEYAAAVLEVIVGNNDGDIIAINILRSGEYSSGDGGTIEIEEKYNTEGSILANISSSNTAGSTQRENAWISYQNQPAYCYIKDIELNIGGQIIDKHTGQYYDIYDEFYNKDPENMDYITGKNKIVGQWPPKDKIMGNIPTLVPREIDLFVPLKFWFTKNIGQSLPMIALQYHDVNIDINFRDLREIIVWNAGKVTPNVEQGNSSVIYHLDFSDIERKRINSREIIKPEIELWANYIYLDTDERKRFAKSGHEYLIEQVQIIKDRYRQNVNIPFNHSVKTLFWTIQGVNCSVEDKMFNNCRHELSNDTVSNNWQKKKLYTPKIPTTSEQATEINITSRHETTNQIEQWLTDDSDVDGSPTDYTIVSNYENGFTQNNNYLFYNSHREDINKSYLNYLEKAEHFKTCKIIMNGIDRIQPQKSIYFRTIQPEECGLRVPKKNLHMYSFALEPLKHQPTGTCNFSKLDSAQLEFDGEQNYANYNIIVYAQNYNILRIMEGMGGLLYNS
tara:strand:+ start:15814 stop:17994 length:2181 start_codon:yes stop_codon:yes gene_type:complete